MANNPKLYAIPGSLLDAVERLINTAPPPKDKKEAADRAEAKRIVKRVRKQPANETARKSTRKRR